MQTKTLDDALDQVLAEDVRYSREAYRFLRKALEKTVQRRRRSKHTDRSVTPPQDVPPEELLDGFRLYALEEFGPMAKEVLNYWNITSCEDIGHMVFNLVRAKLFSKSEQDNLEQFRNGFDFEEAFITPFLPRRKIRHILSKKRKADEKNKPAHPTSP